MFPYWVGTILLLVLAGLAGCHPGIVTPGTQPTLPGGTSSSPVKHSSTSDNQAVTPEALIQETQLPAVSSQAIPIADFLEHLPDPQTATWNLHGTGFSKPVGVFSANDGSTRMYVLEQAGIVRVIENGRLVPEPFLDIRDRVGSRASEQGLLGLAFLPNFSSQGKFFVNYTNQEGHTVISRFSVSGIESDQVDPGSEVKLMLIEQPYANHNGGMVAFGPDNFLYLGIGDGGAADDPLGSGQSTNSLLGKILRIDVISTDEYSIPSDNPFVQGGGRAEIWAYGLRNPWRFSFDRLTGDLYIGDVGQNAWEEINFLPAGSAGGVNFGWNYYEGSYPFQGTPQSGAIFIDPIYEYGHDQGCSVTGGVVYRGSELPTWRGVYLFGDYCSGRVWGLSRTSDASWMSQVLFETGYQIVSFGEDAFGEVYLVDHAGDIYKLSGRE